MNERREIRALVVEPNHQVAAALVALLNDRGVAAEVVADCNFAESAIERYAPDVVIYDLPFHDGREALQAIRRRWRDLPVILCSAERPDVSDLIKGRRTTFLPKPFDGDTLIETIHRMLGAR
ncbi:MAG TPA: response regulator [Thermoanaerobaculia bacterium]|nr:response regulator [Thermoanaerobaculia bacterium]